MNNTNTTHCLCSLIIGPDATCSIGCEIYQMLSGMIAQNTAPEFYKLSRDEQEQNWTVFDITFHQYLDHIQYQLEPVDHKNDQQVLAAKLAIIQTSGDSLALSIVMGWVLEGRYIQTSWILERIQIMIRSLQVTNKVDSEDMQAYCTARTIILVDHNRHVCQHDRVNAGITKLQYTTYTISRSPGTWFSTREDDASSTPDLDLESIHLECLICGKTEQRDEVLSLSHAVEEIERGRYSSEFDAFIERVLADHP